MLHGDRGEASVYRVLAHSFYFRPFYANEASNLCSSDWLGQVIVYWLDGSMATTRNFFASGGLRWEQAGRMTQKIRSSVCGSSRGTRFMRIPYQKIVFSSSLNLGLFNHRESLLAGKFLLGLHTGKHCPASIIYLWTFPHTLERKHLSMLL